MDSFGPLFLVRIPYKNMLKSEVFDTFPKQKYHKDWF